MEKKYYTCAEIAQTYGVKVSTVWCWIRSGKLGSVRIGKRYRVREEDLEVFEASNN